MENRRLQKYILDRINTLNNIDTTNDENLEYKINGSIGELLKLNKMLYNDGVVRTLVDGEIKVDKY